MATNDVIRKLLEADEDARIEAKEDALVGELDEDISRAATSHSPAFPGRKEVSRMVAKRARAIMQGARAENKRPSEVRGVVEDYESFFMAIDSLRIGA